VIYRAHAWFDSLPRMRRFQVFLLVVGPWAMGFNVAQPVWFYWLSRVMILVLFVSRVAYMHRPHGQR